MLHLVGNGKTLSANSGPTNWHLFVAVGCLTAPQRAWPVPPPTLSRISFIPSSQVRNFTKPCSNEASNTPCRRVVRSKTLQSRVWENTTRPQQPAFFTCARLSARSDILPGTTSLKQVPQRAHGWTCGCAELHSTLVWRGNAAASFLYPRWAPCPMPRWAWHQRRILQSANCGLRNKCMPTCCRE